jgi:hypothetical protein
MAVGYPTKVNFATGDILTATQMNDLAGTVNLAVNATPTTATQMAGKNAIINGDFGIWQRGTSFSNPANEAYLADRFNIVYDGSGSTRTISQQTQTPNAISGYDAPYFFRFAQTVAGTAGTYVGMNQRIEGVQTYAALSITLSFWAKADATRTLTPSITQNFGSGGSTSVSTSGTGITLTTSWARYTQTFAIPSISGKTVGTSSYLQLFLGLAANTVQTIDLFGVQLEPGSTATPFQTATGTKQGELAACQRYYFRQGGAQAYQYFGQGVATSITNARILINCPVQMRTTPTSIDYLSLAIYDVSVQSAISAIAFDNAAPLQVAINCTTTAITLARPTILLANATTTSYFGLSAEL